MFKAYFDESGGPESSKALIMAGFLGAKEEWQRATDAWNECLAQSPSVDFFTHKEAQGLRRQFQGWDRPSAEKKVLDLARVISQFKLFGLCAIAPFQILAGKGPRGTKGMMGTRAYDWAFATAVKCVLQIMKEKHSGEMADFVFDEHSALPPNIAMFEFLKQNSASKDIFAPAGTCNPGNDRETVELQMADLLAWEFSKHGKTQLMSEPLKLIQQHNGIGYLRCDPPVQTNATIRLFQLGQDVRNEAIAFLKQIRNPPEDLTAEKITEQINELVRREAYHNVEWGRLLLMLDSDAEYQEFREKFLHDLEDVE